MGSGRRTTLSSIVRMVVFVLSFHKSYPVIDCWGLRGPFCEWGPNHWYYGLTTCQERWGCRINVCTFHISLFFLKLNSSSHMRIINLHVSRVKFECMNHKSSKLRKEINKNQLLPCLNSQLVKPIWSMQVRLAILRVPCSGDGKARPSLHQHKV